MVLRRTFYTYIFNVMCVLLKLMTIVMKKLRFRRDTYSIIIFYIMCFEMREKVFKVKFSYFSVEHISWFWNYKILSEISIKDVIFVK
jgi:hypothetical protein